MNERNKSHNFRFYYIKNGHKNRTQCVLYLYCILSNPYEAIVVAKRSNKAII